MAHGALALVLHAHLPYVRGSEPNSLEEDWFFQALIECYLPLLETLEAAAADPLQHPQLTMGVSPTLLSLLADATLRQRFPAWIDARLGLLNCPFSVNFIYLVLNVGGQADQTSGIADIASNRLCDPVEAVGAEPIALCVLELFSCSDESQGAFLHQVKIPHATATVPPCDGVDQSEVMHDERIPSFGVLSECSADALEDRGL